MKNRSNKCIRRECKYKRSCKGKEKKEEIMKENGDGRS